MIDYDDESHSLPSVSLALRDSLSALALQILVARDDFKTLSNKQRMHELYLIIGELHEIYDSSHGAP
ncbi:hypothetical protein [Selenomonas ruminantium]|uniref:Uncharacterized protein n=1 Tax=Selenomonas ruminantium TaxID=971 RepID=A0A1H0P4N1_SELRU|nr:hypothetical protein [Selenomonas ruminantium]SDO99640.1 hypothetical protein SAMN05216366_10498 [Selenomonas ruminantium]